MNIQEFVYRDGSYKFNYAVDSKAILSFATLYAHYRAVADATKTYSKARSWLASVGWVQKSSYQAVDWALQKRLKQQYITEQMIPISRGFQLKDPGIIRTGIYKMYTARFEAEEKVREEAGRISRVNQGVVDGAEVATFNAQIARDTVFIGLSLICTPASGGAMVFGCAVNVLGSAANKYIDTGGNTQAAFIEGAGALVGVGFGKVATSANFNGNPKTVEVLGVVGAAADGLSESLCALAEGKSYQDAIVGGLTKAGIIGGAGVIAGRLASKINLHGDDIVMANRYFRQLGTGKLNKAAEMGEAASGFGAGVIAKEVGRDRLELAIPVKARSGPRMKTFQEFKSMMDKMIWLRWSQRFDNDDVQFYADR